MIRIEQIWPLAALMMALASCNTSDQVLDIDWDSGNQEVTEADTAQLLPVEIRINPKIEANAIVEDFSWQEGMRLSVFGRSSDVRDVVNSNIMARYTGGSWEINPALLIGEGGMDIYLAYPYQADAKAENMPVKPLMDDTFIYGKSSIPVTQYTRTSTIYLSSPLAYVAFYLRKIGEMRRFDCILTGITIEGTKGSIPVEGELNMLNGIVTPTAYGKYEKYCAPVGGVVTTRADGTLSTPIQLQEEYTEDNVEFHTLPMTISTMEEGLARFVFTINGQEYQAEVEGGKQIMWKQGSINTIKVAFDGKTVDIEDVSISEWVTIEDGQELITPNPKDN